MEAIVTCYAWDVEVPETWKTLKDGIECTPWSVVVEMVPLKEEMKGFILPDNAQRRKGADIGVVIKAGKDVFLNPGDVVIVHPSDGKIVEDLYECKNECRIYGSWSKSLGRAEVFPWDDSILAVLKGGEWRATGNNVIMRLEQAVDKVGEIYLPDSATYRDDRGTVLSVGESVIDVKPGDTVCFAKRALIKIEKEDDELYVIHQKGIYFVEV